MIKETIIVGGLVTAGCYLMWKHKMKKDNQRVTLDELAAQYSDECDRMIELGSEKGSLYYVGGRFCMQKAEVDSIRLDIQMYFQNQQGEWIQKQIGKTVPLSRLTKEAQAELLSRGEVQYELEPPKAKASM
ncbi:hypothetical protein [Brevibacillus invocatus]|uniref:Uncharacterized protein n=1 Tax=Brevibacillus invocatus TaxID=173959 RepID=A0A3M8CK51_9BACL|nr:hypothetical protein [Brevibacillus invocatus]MCM3078364.1 hypothetical protein [Brevibacillus invocatus]MCM3428481.1 hypothetical protein [Brevibacillus invocatus]RNB76126.1 hypothetical protein EDM52_04215 [Brevibacillus invocatus]